jgi:AraC-like DNA-binding protein
MLPGCAPALLGIAAQQVRDARIPVAETLARGAACEQVLAESADPLGTLRDELLEQGARAPRPDPLVQAAVARLGLPISELARDLGVSERQLRRRVTTAVGYGPRRLARVLRLGRAVGGSRGRRAGARRLRGGLRRPGALHARLPRAPRSWGARGGRPARGGATKLAGELVAAAYARGERATAPRLAHGLSLADLAHAVALVEGGDLRGASSTRRERALLRGPARAARDPRRRVPVGSRARRRLQLARGRARAAHRPLGRRLAQRRAPAAGGVPGRPPADRARRRPRAARRARDQAAALARHARATADALATDYTYLQPAQPTTVGHLLLTYAYPALRDADAACASYDALGLSVAGAGGSAGSRWALDRLRLAELLGCDGLDRAREGRRLAGRRLRRAARDPRDRRDAPEPARPGLRDLREPGVRARRARRRPQPRERADAAEEEPVRPRRDPHPGRAGRRRRRGRPRRAAHRLGAHRPLPPAERHGAARARRGRRDRAADGVGARRHRAAPGALRADRARELRHRRRRLRRPRAARAASTTAAPTRSSAAPCATSSRPASPRPR